MASSFPAHAVRWISLPCGFPPTGNLGAGHNLHGSAGQSVSLTLCLRVALD